MYTGSIVHNTTYMKKQSKDVVMDAYTLCRHVWFPNIGVYVRTYINGILSIHRDYCI